MAQLSDDCFAFSGPLLPVAEMERLITERVAPVAETEEVALAAALGRVVAADVVAAQDLPPFDNSAVDGFAVRHADLSADAETRLVIVDRALAGHQASHTLGRGQAIRIFTGAPMPPGADTVFMQEDCRIEDDVVVVPQGLERGANSRVRRRGPPCRCGDAAGGAPADRGGPRARRRAGRDDRCACGAGSRSRCSRPATRWSNPARHGRPPRSTTPTGIFCARCWKNSALR